MADGIFLDGIELAERPPEPAVKKERIVAEAPLPPLGIQEAPPHLAGRLLEDAAFESEGHATDEAGASAAGRDISQKAEELAVVPGVRGSRSGKPGGNNTRRPLQSIHGQPRILGQREEARSFAVKRGFAPGIGGERRAGFRIFRGQAQVGQTQDADRKVFQEDGDLTGFSAVGGGYDKGKGRGFQGRLAAGRVR